MDCCFMYGTIFTSLVYVSVCELVQGLSPTARPRYPNDIMIPITQ